MRAAWSRSQSPQDDGFPFSYVRCRFARLARLGPDDGGHVVQSERAGGSEGHPVRGSGVSFESPPEPERPGGFFSGQVAQLVEHTTENRGVGGSIPPLAMESAVSALDVAEGP